MISQGQRAGSLANCVWFALGQDSNKAYKPPTRLMTTTYIIVICLAIGL